MKVFLPIRRVLLPLLIITLSFAREHAEAQCAAQALNFTGVAADNQYMIITSNNSVKLNTDNFTVSVWINLRSTTGFQPILSNAVSGSAFSSYDLYVQDGKAYFLSHTDNSAARDALVSNGTIPTNSWTNITVVRSKNYGITMYLNGVSDKYQTWPVANSWNSPNNLFVGNVNGIATFLNGAVDELQFFDIALSGSQVESNYRNYFVADNATIYAGMKAYFDFNSVSDNPPGNCGGITNTVTSTIYGTKKPNYVAGYQFPVYPPVINSFTADANPICDNKTTPVRWNWSGTKTTVNFEKQVASGWQNQTSDPGPGRYRLTVTSPCYAPVSQILDITAKPRPSVETIDFRASALCPNSTTPTVLADYYPNNNPEKVKWFKKIAIGDSLLLTKVWPDGTGPNVGVGFYKVEITSGACEYPISSSGYKEVRLATKNDIWSGMLEGHTVSYPSEKAIDTIKSLGGAMLFQVAGASAYTWQYSIDTTTWYTVAGATGEELPLPTLTTSRYYRRNVMCGTPFPSNIVRVGVFTAANGMKNGSVKGRITSKNGVGVAGVSITAQKSIDLKGSLQSVKYSATSDVNGYYQVKNMFYGDASNGDVDAVDFTVVPSKGNHGFVSPSLTATLESNYPTSSNNDFVDTTVFSLTGQVFQTCTGCRTGSGSDTVTGIVTAPIDSVQMFKDGGFFMRTGFLSFPNTPDSFGRYATVITDPGTYNLKPSFKNHVFYPASKNVTVSDNVKYVNFEDKTQRTLTGKLTDGCGKYIGQATLLFEDILPKDDQGNKRPSVFRKSIVTADQSGYYSISLPARKYKVKVESFKSSFTSTDPAYIAETDLKAFINVNYDSTDNKTGLPYGALVTDLSDSNQVLNLKYERPPTITIKGFNDTCRPVLKDSSYGYIEQGKTKLITYEIYQGQRFLYGTSGCPLPFDSAKSADTIIVSTNISADDINEIRKLRVGLNGAVTDTIKGGTPKITGDFLKSLTATFEDKYKRQGKVANQTKKVVVLGFKQSSGTFATVSPEIPFMVLHDPPGDLSSSYWNTSTSNEEVVSWTAQGSVNNKTETQVKLGAKTLSGLGVMVESQSYGKIGATLEVNAKAGGGGETVITTTTTQNISTSSDQDITGDAGDLYIGAAMNLLYSTSVEVSNKKYCSIDTAKKLLIAPKGFATEYYYTEHAIRNEVIPTLQNFVSTASADSTRKRYQNQIKVWEQVLANNAMNKKNAAFEKNISFAGSAGPIANTISSKSSKKNIITFGLEISTGVGAECNLELGGTGVEGKSYVTIKAEAGGSLTSTTTNETTTGYTLDDDDALDFFTVNVKRDPVYNTPVFETIAGKSSCPPEANTLPRDSIYFELPEGTVRTGVPTTDPAQFKMVLTNISADAAARTYRLSLNPATNPGAIVSVNGIIMGASAIPYTINPGASVTVFVNVRKDPSVNIYSYEGLQFTLADACTGDISKTQSISAFFTSPCSDIKLAEPENNFVISSSNATTFPVVFKNYDVAGFQTIALEYSEAGTSIWNNAASLASNQIQNSINGATIYWNTTSIPDGIYNLRLRLTCSQGVVYSERVTGIIDRQAPSLFGKPTPTDNNYVKGDVISFLYNENITPVTLANIQVVKLPSKIAVPFSISDYANKVSIILTDTTSAKAGDSLMVVVSNIRDIYKNTKTAPDTLKMIVGKNALNTGSKVLNITASPSSKAEGLGYMDVVFALPAAATSDVQVNYTIGGTATFDTARSNTDYTVSYTATTVNGINSFDGTDGIIYIPKGSTSVRLRITPVTDTIVESNETILITLLDGGDYIIGSKYFVKDTIIDDPKPFITASGPVKFCPGDSVTLTAATPGYPSAIHTWFLNNAQLAAAGNKLVVKTAGSYTVKSSESASTSSPVATALKVKPALTSVTADKNPFCTGDSVLLKAVGAAGTGYKTIWSLPGSIQRTGDSIRVGLGGLYTAQVSGECPAPVAKTITLTSTSAGISSVTASDTSICLASTTSLAASGVSGNNAVVKWFANPNGVDSIGTGLLITGVSPGTYYARAISSDGCIGEKSIIVNPKVDIGITSVTAAKTLICSNVTTILTANGVKGSNNVVKWYSQAGGAGTSLGTGLTLVAGPGTYYARVTGDCGLPAEASVTVRTYASEATVATCSSYTWNNKTYTTSGDYIYKTISSVGCDSTAILHLTIKQPTTSQLAVTTCDNYTWNGNTYSTSGIYTYKTINAAGCDSIATLNLTVQAFKPVVTPTVANPCNGESSTITASGAVSYLWSSGQTGPSIIVNPAATTTYTVTATGSNGCIGTATATVVVNNLAVNITAPTLCMGSEITAAISGTISTIEWQLEGVPVAIFPGNKLTGKTVAGGNGDGSNANQLNNAAGVFIDKAGNLYIADAYNHRVQKWAPGASTGITVAGGNGLGSAANQLNFPKAVFVDSIGNIYIADYRNDRIQKWAPGATTGVTVAGGNGRGSAANQLNTPTGVFVDASQNIFIADNDNDRVQKWVPGSTAGVTVAGGMGYGSAANQLASPVAVVLDNAGNIYVSDQGNDRVQKWAQGATSGTTVAGGQGYGSAINQLASPAGISLDSSNNLFVADADNNRVQKWPADGSRVITAAGGNGYGDNPNQFDVPSGAFIDKFGNLFVADQFNSRIQKFDYFSFTNKYTPDVVGNYSATITSATGCDASSNILMMNPIPDGKVSPSAATICSGQSITLAASGGTSYLWSIGSKTTASVSVNPISTTVYSVKITALACTKTVTSTVMVSNPKAVINPSSVNICSGQSATLTASGGVSYAWNNGSTNRAITVTPAVTTPYTVTVTDSFGCKAKTSRYVDVSSAPTVTISPAAPAICAGQTITLTATGGSSYLWSNGATTSSITVSPGTTTTYTVTVGSNNGGCNATASVTVNVNSLPIAMITPASAVICAGQSQALTASGGGSYIWSNGATTASITVNPTSTTTYSVVVSNTANCTAAVATTVSVRPVSFSDVTVTACDSYAWNGITYNASGNYTYKSVNSIGCDSTVTLHLTVTRSSTSQQNATACGSYTWNGTTYTSSGTYTFLTTNAKGCDSTATLYLSIKKSSSSQQSATSCNTYTWNGKVYTASGVYTYTTSNFVGCDSTATLNLTIKKGSTSQQSVVNCNSYTWNGSVYTTSGTYTYTTNNAAGCDSVATLNLIINKSSSSQQSVTSCSSYTWNGKVYTTSGTYRDTSLNVNGCDSIATLNLTISTIAPTISPATATICSGGNVTITASGSSNYSWSNGAATNAITVSPTATTTYTVTVSNSAGCSATATSTVIVNNAPVAAITANGPTTICSGSSVNLIASGSALSFNGTNQYINNNTGYPATNELTYELWINPKQFVDGGFSTILNHTGWATGRVHFQFSGSTLQFAINGNTPADRYSSFAFNTNSWYHIAAVYSQAAKNLKIYVNGALKDSLGYTATVPVAANVPFLIGAWDNQRYLNGVMDEFRIWNVARTGSEIAANWDKSVPAFSAGLVSYYKMDEGFGTSTTADSKGTLTGTLINGPSWVASTPALAATYLWSNGATTQTIPVSDSGSYFVTVTQPNTGCFATSSLKLVTVNPTVTAGTVTGTSFLCIGSTASYTTSGTTGGRWSSDTTGIATVDSTTGLVTAIKAGTVNIKYTVNSGCGSPEISQKTLTVNAATVITSNLTAAVYSQNATATALSVSASGAGTLGYQWYRNTTNSTTGGTLVSAAASYTPSTSATGTSYYYVVVTGTCGSASSNAAAVTVNSLMASALNFDGTNDYVSLPSTISSAGDFSWEAWIKTSDYGTIIAKTVSPTSWSNGKALFVQNGKIVFDVWNVSSISSPLSYNDSIWHHVVVTGQKDVSGSNDKIIMYVDGVQVVSRENWNVDGYSEAGLPSFIGSGYPNATNYFKGTIDEVRMWNRVLCPAEINANMNCQLSSAKTGLLAYYKFNQGYLGNDNTGITTLYDSSGNGRNGTLNFFGLTGTTSNWVAGKVSNTSCSSSDPCSITMPRSISASNSAINTAEQGLKPLTYLLSPNPTNSYFRLQFTGGTVEDVQIRVTDVNGKKVYETKGDKNSTYTFGNSLLSGVYFVEVRQGKEVKIIKAVKFR